MKAVVYHDIGDIRLEDVPEPGIEDSKDSLVRLTSSAICGTDLHMVRGTMPGMEPGTILGHEGVGIVEDVGSNVRNFAVGDRVVVSSTIACGYCSYCRAGYFSQCDNATPNGSQAGTCFFGGPKATGSVNGLQAEMARVPFANVGMVKIPDSVTDEQALMLSDIFPTGYFGTDRAIDAVGVDAVHPHSPPAVAISREQQQQFDEEMQEVAPELFTHQDEAERWHPGDAPSQVLQWAMQSIAKAGTIGIIGVYPENMRFFPIGKAMNKNLSIHMGNCPHRKYIPMLMQIISAGSVKPERIITQQQPIVSALDAYRMFADKKAGWMKVELRP